MRAHRIAGYKRGLRAESLAAWILRCKGYRILSARYKTPVGEIDLIARRGKTIAFVEVKSRGTRRDAAESIHPRNQSRVVRAAQYYLSAHPDCIALTVRFDAVLVAWYRWPHHIPQAFDASSAG